MQVHPTKKGLMTATIVLVVLHLIGFIGIHSSYKALFLSLTPLNLCLSAALLFYFQEEKNKSFWLFLVFSFIAGFFIEVAGVKTGAIFGVYHYDQTLGFKLLNVPIVIGINWAMLVYSAGCILNRFQLDFFVKCTLAALLLVGLDLVMEPVAMQNGFWSWENNSIPFQNYLAWFIVSFLLVALFFSAKFNKHNPLAKTLLIIQFIFFVLLRSF